MLYAHLFEVHNYKNHVQSQIAEVVKAAERSRIDPF